MSCEHDRPVSERPRISKDTWFGYAVGAAIVTLVAYGFAAGAIFFDDSADQETAKALAPFGTALLAGVTFLTIVWRGVISEIQLELQSKQLAQQIDQLEQVIRQNDTKDAEYKAKLLQDAAKLLSETDKAPQVRAGITSLDVLIRDPNKTHSVTAMNMLAEYLARTYFGGYTNTLHSSTINALATGHELGVFASDPIRLKAPDDDQEGDQLASRQWPIIRGIKNLTIEGGEISGDVYREYKKLGVAIRRASIENITFDNDDLYGCEFLRCQIRKADLSDIKANSFRDCDFSNALITNDFIDDIENIYFGSSFYLIGNAPSIDGVVDPAKILQEITRKEREERLFPWGLF